MTIKAIVFDIGGVLEITPETSVVRTWLERLNLKRGELSQRLEATGKDGALGTCTEAEWWDGVREITGIDDATLAEFRADFWKEYLGTHNVELDTYFRSLRPKYKTAILSNSFVGAREKEHAAYGFEDACDFIIYSHEVGMQKPDPRVYLLTCERLGVQPSEVIFLDDHKEAVDPAIELGIHGVVFENTAQAVADIEACIQTNL